MPNLLNQLDVENLINLNEVDNIEKISPKNFIPNRRKYNRPKDSDWKIKRDKLKKQKQKERNLLTKELDAKLNEK